MSITEEPLSAPDITAGVSNGKTAYHVLKGLLRLW